MADKRLNAVYEAASFLFVRKGYANTQVSEIAEKANIATGTIYNLFAGKKAILHFVLLCSFDKHYLDREISLPIKEVDDELIIQHLCQIVEKLFSKIEEKTKDGEPALSFVDMFSTAFDCAASYNVGFNIISYNISALEEVKKVYMKFSYRVHEIFEENLLYYIKRGEVRKVELPELHIRNILEGITWWSMYLPYQVPDINVPVDKAKEIAVDIIKNAYLVKSE